MGYAFNEMVSIYANGFWTHTQANRVLEITQMFLIPELFNSNSNLYRINTGLNYRFANGVTAGPIAQLPLSRPSTAGIRYQAPSSRRRRVGQSAASRAIT